MALLVSQAMSCAPARVATLSPDAPALEHWQEAVPPPAPARALTDPAVVRSLERRESHRLASNGPLAVAPPSPEPPAVPTLTIKPLPKAEDLPDHRLHSLVTKGDLAALGPLSLGKANGGALINAVQLPEGPYWEIIDRRRAWATQETIDALTSAIKAVNAQFPGTHKMYIGHLSWSHGGPIRPHLSHQSGRDIDVSYYYSPASKAEWYRRATRRTLDRARTWAFIRTLLTDFDVEYMFIDHSVQKLLRRHALDSGEDPEWIASVFQHRSRHPSPIIRHAYGHSTHIHIRLYNPRAQRLGLRVYDKLVEQRIVTPKQHSVRHKARPGDSLESIAKRYATTAEAIIKVNRMWWPKPTVKPGRMYIVPTRGWVKPVASVIIPERRLPPQPDRDQGIPVTAASRAGR